jgi:ANTAR domain-containing protein
LIDRQDETAVALRRLLAVTEASFEQRAQLERALRSRIRIEQAKGMLAERLRLSLDEAFELLRRAARSNRRRVQDLAREVVERPETPVEIVAALHELLAPSGSNKPRRRVKRGGEEREPDRGAGGEERRDLS